MPSVSDIFGVISEAISSFANTLGTAFSSITSLFWTSGESGGSFTLLGTLTLIALGAGLVYLAFNIIRGLLRRVRG